MVCVVQLLHILTALLTIWTTFDPRVKLDPGNLSHTETRNTPGFEDLVQEEGRQEGQGGGEARPDKPRTSVKVLRAGAKENHERGRPNVLVVIQAFHNHLQQNQGEKLSQILQIPPT